MQNQRKARAAAHEVKFSASTRHVPDQDPGWGCKVIENSRRRHVPGRQHPGWGCKVIKNSGRPARDRQLPPEEQDWILHQKAGWKCHHPGAPGEEDQAAMRRANIRSVVLKHAPDGHLLRRTPSQHDWAAAAKRVQLEGERARGPVRADGEGRDAYLLDNYEFVSEHHIRRKPATAPTCSLLDKMRPHDALTGNQMLADGANQNNRYRPWNVRGLEKLQPAVDENVWEPKYRDGRPGWKQWKRAAAHVNPPHMHQLDGAGAKVAALAGMLRSASSAPAARGAATPQEQRASALEKMLRLPLGTKQQDRPLSAAQAQRSIALHPKNLRQAY